MTDILGATPWPADSYNQRLNALAMMPDSYLIGAVYASMPIMHSDFCGRRQVQPRSDSW